MSYSPYDHGRSSSVSNALHAPVGVGDSSFSYLETTSHPLINTWKEKLTGPDENQKWGKTSQDTESFQAPWSQGHNSGICHESFSQGSVTTFQGGYSFFYQSFQGVHLNSYVPSYGTQIDPLENSLGGIRHSISHLLRAKTSTNEVRSSSKRKRSRSERKRLRLQKQSANSDDGLPPLPSELLPPEPNLCAVNLHSTPIPSSQGHLKEINSGNQILKETGGSACSEHDSPQVSRSPIVGQENSVMNLQIASGLEDKYSQRNSTSSRRKNRHAKRDKLKLKSKHARSPSSKTKVISLPLDSSTFFGTQSSAEGSIHYSPVGGSGWSSTRGKSSGNSVCSEEKPRLSSGEKSSRRRHKRRSSQGRRSKEFLETSVRSTTMGIVSSSIKSSQGTHQGLNDVMATPMSTGRLLKHARRNSSDQNQRTPTNSFEDSKGSKSRRSSPSKSDVKPKALIKPGLRSAKKDPRKTPAKCTPMKLADSNGDGKRFIQKTIDSFFGKSASKSFEGTLDEIQTRPKSRKEGKEQTEPGAADSHVRRILYDSPPVVRVAPLTDANIPRGESESVARLARVAPIVSAPSAASPDSCAPSKRPRHRLRSPSTPSPSPPPRKRRCSGVLSSPSELDAEPAADPRDAPRDASPAGGTHGGTRARRSPSKRLQCCSPVSEATAADKAAEQCKLDDSATCCPPSPRRQPQPLSPAKCTRSRSPGGALLAESPAKMQLRSPAKAPLQASVEVHSRTPTKVPSKTPTKAPTKTPTKAPSKTPTKAPTKTPTKAPTKTPTKAPAKSPAKSPQWSTGKARSPASKQAEPSPDDEFAQAKWEEVNRRAEAALAAARNKTRHSRGRKVYVFCEVLSERLERHPVQNEIPENNWSRWLNPTQLRVLTLAMLGNRDVCLNYSLELEYNQDREDFWMALSKRLNTVCYNPLTNLNTGLRLTVAEWKNLWIELRTRLIERTKAMTPEQRRHSLGSLECLLFSVDLYERLKKSNGECLGEDCPRVWCVGACVGVPSPDWSPETCGR